MEMIYKTFVHAIQIANSVYISKIQQLMQLRKKITSVCSEN